MSEYQVNGTAREKHCDKEASITHIVTANPENKVYSVSNAISLINAGSRFWSYVYLNGQVLLQTKIEIEVVEDRIKGQYLRTRRDRVEENNLLELPICYKTSEGNYHWCR